MPVIFMHVKVLRITTLLPKVVICINIKAYILKQ